MIGFPFQKISLIAVKRVMGRKKAQSRCYSSDLGEGMVVLWTMMVAAETGISSQDIFWRSHLQTWWQMEYEGWR